MLTATPTWSLPAGNTVVPSRWQATGVSMVSGGDLVIVEACDSPCLQRGQRGTSSTSRCAQVSTGPLQVVRFSALSSICKTCIPLLGVTRDRTGADCGAVWNTWEAEATTSGSRTGRRRT